MTPHDRIGLLAVARALVSQVGSAPVALRGAANLATVWPNTKYSIGRLLEQQAARYPEKDCLVFAHQRWNYRDFNAWANRIASVLKDQGVGHGDTVGLLFENSPALLACVAASVKLGAVAGMLNPHQRGAVLKYSVDRIKPKVIVVGDALLAALHTAYPQRPRATPWLWVGAGAAPPGMVDLARFSERAGAANPPDTDTIAAREPCCLIFTSGTTGLPKAAVMTHLRWLRSGYGMGQMAMRLRADDIFYCPLPFHHNSALTLCWSSVLVAGATLVMAKKFSASRFWDDIRRTRATAFVYIGELCRYLLNNPKTPQDRAHSIRVMIGNGLRPEIWDAFQQRFGVAHICEFYGSSEGNLVFVNAFGLPRTAGFSPQPYAIVAFDAESEQAPRDARGFMRRVADGEVGLLITEVSALSPFDGYTDPAETQAKLLHDVFRQGDTWINSGDLVRGQGVRHIAFVDRVGDTFRWKGENVATTEVEGTVLAMSGIDEASVYGVCVAHADGRAGMAAIVMKAGATFDKMNLAMKLCEQLPAYAVPLFIRVIPAQETTATFKNRKVELKRQGFDPAVVRDPLFVLLDRERGYEELTQPIYRQIVAGRLRL